MSAPVPDIPMPKAWVLHPPGASAGAQTGVIVVGAPAGDTRMTLPPGVHQILFTWSGAAAATLSVWRSGDTTRQVATIPAGTLGVTRTAPSVTVAAGPATTVLTVTMTVEQQSQIAASRASVTAYPVPPAT